MLMGHYHAELYLIKLWMQQIRGLDVRIVAAIFQLVAPLQVAPLQVRIHFVVQADCNGCCGESTLTVGPHDAPAGKERFFDAKRIEVLLRQTAIVEPGSHIYLQHHWNDQRVCCAGWKETKIHKALSDCKEAGDKVDGAEYGAPTKYTWSDLQQGMVCCSG